MSNDLNADINYFTPSDMLTGINGFSLFYPCSASDYLAPARILGKVCRDLHFADVRYFSDQLDRNSRRRISIGREAIWRCCHERLIEITREDWERDIKYCGVQPRVRSHLFTERVTGIDFRLHLHRGRAPTVMREELDQLGVFFHRGDSRDGSGTMWLTKRLPMILKQAAKKFDELICIGPTLSISWTNQLVRYFISQNEGITMFLRDRLDHFSDSERVEFVLGDIKDTIPSLF